MTFEEIEKRNGQWYGIDGNGDDTPIDINAISASEGSIDTLTGNEADLNSLRTGDTDTDDLTVNGIQTRTEDESARPGVKARRLDHGRFQTMLMPVGTVIPTTPTRLVPTEETVNSTDWTVLSELHYGYLESPPNMVPIIRCMFDVSCDTDGQTAEFRVQHSTMDDSTANVATSAHINDNDRGQYLDMCYFNEVDEPGTGYGKSFLKFTIEGRVTDAAAVGTLHPGSTVILEHEVI